MGPPGPPIMPGWPWGPPIGIAPGGSPWFILGPIGGPPLGIGPLLFPADGGGHCDGGPPPGAEGRGD